MANSKVNMKEGVSPPIRDIEDLQVDNLRVIDIYRTSNKDKLRLFILDFIRSMNEFKSIGSSYNKVEWRKIYNKLRKDYSVNPGIVQMNYMYRLLLSEGEIKRNFEFEKNCVGKEVRVNSGVVVITVLTSPYPNGKTFSCPHDCYYCPNEPGQPRSYLKNEPAVLRANNNAFDAANQFWDRASALSLNGIKIDKIELLVLGGTWSSYPLEYQREFCRDLYYAANTFYSSSNSRRSRLELWQEIYINEKSKIRIIGLTLETRPDYINSTEIKRFREYGCTRVQIGVQHTNKRILSKINRGCYTEDSIRAIRNLKDCGFKVDIHLMPDLPGSTPEIDGKMFNKVLIDADLQADQWKIYPCETTPFSKIEEWHKKGQYEHYSEEELIEVILDVKCKVHPWIRLNRVIRDIPNEYILAGNEQPNLRQVLLRMMKERGWKCRCIRCREVKAKSDAINLIDKAEMVVRKYNASNGLEYFISYESPSRDYIYGFCRLRLTNNAGYTTDILPRIQRDKNNKDHDIENEVNCFPFLNNVALVRELHVYGTMKPVDKKSETNSQHRGFGKKLLKKAEHIARKHRFKHIAVISGVGVREYYNKLGYKYYKTYMIKKLKNNNSLKVFILMIIILFLSLFLFINFY